MPRRALAVAGLVALAALAGCAGSTAPSSTEPPRGSTQSTSASGGLQAFAGAVYHTEFLNFTGETPVGGCLFTLVSQCEFRSGSNFMQELGPTAHAVLLEGNATLTGPAAAASSVQALLFADTSAGRAIVFADDTFWDGASPLHFRMNLTPYAGQKLYLGIFSAEAQDFGVGFLFADVPQAFAVEARLVFAEPAQATAAV
jgi:hypothetical protein